MTPKNSHASQRRKKNFLHFWSPPSLQLEGIGMQNLQGVIKSSFRSCITAIFNGRYEACIKQTSWWARSRNRSAPAVIGGGGKNKLQFSCGLGGTPTGTGQRTSVMQSTMPKPRVLQANVHGTVRLPPGIPSMGTLLHGEPSPLLSEYICLPRCDCPNPGPGGVSSRRCSPQWNNWLRLCAALQLHM